MTSGAGAAGVPTTENCRFCWMCRHVCPVGFVTQRETYTPHAWALTVESVKRGQLQWNAESADVMYACADCGLCQAHCATDQPLPDAIAAAREAIVAVGGAPSAVLELRDRLALHGHPYPPGRAAAPGPARDARAGTSSAGARRPTALFVGDAAHHLAPSAVDAAKSMLEIAGVPTVPVGVGRSSGWLASSIGLRDVASGLAQQVLEEIREVGASEVIVLSTADRWAFEHVFPVRLGITWPTDVIVREAVDVLAEASASGRLRLRRQPGTAYAYHDPCHGPRLGRDGSAARRLLDTVMGASEARALFWREGRAHPCGAIGGLEFTHPAIARALAESRLLDARAAGAARLVTDDASCSDHLKRVAPADILVENLYDVLASACVR